MFFIYYDSVALCIVMQITLYLWSLLFAILVVLISIIPVAVSRYSNNFKIKNIQMPRALFNVLPMWGKRAYWAHQNCFESICLHSPAVLLAIILSLHGIVLPEISIKAAFLYPIFRLLYLASYLSNRFLLRAFFWGGGLGCSIIIYVNSLHAVFSYELG